MIFDNSSIQQFKDCPERYRLKFVRGLLKRDTGIESHDREFGSAIHAGLESWYKTKSHAHMMAAFEAEYGVQLDIEDKAKTLEGGKLALETYVKTYPTETFEILEVETPHTFIINGESFTVKRDMVIRMQGCVYVMEHKTTKKTLGWDYWSQFEPNSQLTAQVYSCKLKYGECSGVFVNAIQVGHRERAYKGEPAGLYTKLQRQLFNRNSVQTEAWLCDTGYWINQIKRYRSDETGDGKVFIDNGPVIWPKNEGQCKYCEYKEVCTSVADEQVIEQLYEKVDPFSYLGDMEKKEVKGE